MGITQKENWVSQVALEVKNQPVNAGDIREEGSIPGLRKSPGRRHGNPLQYSCLENSMDRGAWWTRVHAVAELDTTEVTWHACTCTHRRTGFKAVPGQGILAWGPWETLGLTGAQLLKYPQHGPLPQVQGVTALKDTTVTRILTSELFTPVLVCSFHSYFSFAFFPDLVFFWLQFFITLCGSTTQFQIGLLSFSSHHSTHCPHPACLLPVPPTAPRPPISTRLCLVVSQTAQTPLNSESCLVCASPTRPLSNGEMFLSLKLSLDQKVALSPGSLPGSSQSRADTLSMKLGSFFFCLLERLITIKLTTRWNNLPPTTRLFAKELNLFVSWLLTDFTLISIYLFCLTLLCFASNF